MASRELNILVVAKGALKAARDIGAVDKATSKLRSNAGRLGKAAAVGIGAGVTVGAVVIGRGVKSGIESLALLEDATTQVQGAIDQIGLSGSVSAQQVATWANDIEGSVDAAFDDKDIVSATATLIRFGKVTPSNLKPAMVVMTDLAAKTGSVDSAAELLAKALADPTKAAGKLARQGIVLTKVEQDQIKAMVKAGKTAEAQEFLLSRLAETTKDAAKASAGPYRDSLNILADVTEDAQRALGEGFLPVIEKVRDILTKQLAKPGTMTAIRDFGKGLAGGLEKLIDVAMGLPWDQIKTTFQVMGTGSKAVLDAFLGLPPWVQTAVLTAWGTNKITGGLVGELGKGLIKGVLGMTAGVVNINAGVVNGAGGGGIPGAAGAAGGAAAGAGIGGGAAAALALAGPAIGVALGEMSRQAFEQMPSHQQIMEFRGGRTRQDAVLGREPATNKPIPVTFKGFGGRSPEERGEKRVAGEAAVQERAIAAGLRPTADQITRTYNATSARQEAASRTAVSAAQQAAFATRDGTDRIVAAIHGIRIPQPVVNFTAADTVRKINRRRRTVTPAGSRDRILGGMQEF